MNRILLHLVAVAAAFLLGEEQSPTAVPDDRYHVALPARPGQLNESEERLVTLVAEKFGKLGQAEPAFDPAIAAACRELCTVLDCQEESGGAAWEPQTIRFTLRKHGITDGFHFPLVARVDDESEAGEVLAGLVSRELAHLGINRFGLAYEPAGQGMVAAVFTRRLAQLGPFPRSAEPGSLHLLWGSATGPAASPEFFLSMPDGGIVQLKPNESSGLFWNQLYFPQEAGEYIVEVMVWDDGPQVASLFPVYVGIPVPTRPELKLYPGVDERASPPELEDQMVALINRERQRKGVPACRTDASLRSDARRYSQAMASAGRMSHMLDRSGESKSLAYTENISLSTTLHAAHTNLLASPSHRRNLLADEATLCAVGIAQRRSPDGSRVLYVTQRFAASPK